MTAYYPEAPSNACPPCRCPSCGHTLGTANLGPAVNSPYERINLMILLIQRYNKSVKNSLRNNSLCCFHLAAKPWGWIIVRFKSSRTWLSLMAHLKDVDSENLLIKNSSRTARNSLINSDVLLHHPKAKVPWWITVWFKNGYTSRCYQWLIQKVLFHRVYQSRFHQNWWGTRRETVVV